MNSYIITVNTSDKLGAGTDANVYIELIGRKSVSSGKLVLGESKTNKNKFEKGKTDVFEIKCRDVGSLRRIVIGHDNKGSNSAWHLKNVYIKSKLDGRVWLCECNRWLDKMTSDGKIEVELEAVEQQFANEDQLSRDVRPIQQRDLIDDDHEMRREKSFRKNNLDFDFPMKTKKESLCRYKIKVKTSDLKFAGTDANVFIELYGKQFKTERIILKNSLTNKNPFEQGHVDVFELEALDVGKLEKIRVGHDNKGLGPGWHVDEIAIKTEDGKKYYFPCNKWFDKKENDGQIERDLFPHEKIRENANKSHRLIGSILNYDISVVTSDIQGAGTDANVYMKIYGELRKSAEINLNKSKTHMNKFEKGHTDIFNIKEEYLGDIKQIKIRHDNTGVGAPWHLKEVIIESIEADKKWIFPCNRWLDKGNGDGKIEIKLTPLDFHDLNSKKKRYKVEVFTGDEKKAGTDAEVYLKMYGEKLESTEFHLKESETHMNKFERNHMDRFHLDCEDLGYIFAIRVRHDNSGILPEWFLDRIEITDESDGTVYVFICRKWFALKKDDGKIERYLFERNYKPKDANKNRRKKKKDNTEKNEKDVNIPREYYIKIYTGNRQNKNGTDMEVSIKLFGDEKVSDEFKLSQTKTHESKFIPDQIDLFVIKTNDDLGTIYALELRYEQCLKSANDLNLERIEVVDDNVTYRFMADEVLSVKNTNERFRKIILLEQNAEFI